MSSMQRYFMINQHCQENRLQIDITETVYSNDCVLLSADSNNILMSNIPGKAAIHMGMKPPTPSTSATSLSAASSEGVQQRYFRIPFVRPADQNRDGEFTKKGTGYYYTNHRSDD